MDMLPSFNGFSGFLLLVLGFGFIIFVHELGHFLVAKWVGIKCPQFAIGFGQALLSWRKGMGIKRGSTENEYFNRLSEWLKQQGEEPGKFADEPAAWTDEQLQRAEEALTTMDDAPTKKKERAAAIDKWLDEQGETKVRAKTWTPDQLDRASAALNLSETEYRLNWMPLGGYVKMLGQEDLDPNAASDDPRSYNSKPIWARACVISAGVVMNIIFGVIFFIIAFMGGFGVNKAEAGPISPRAASAVVYAEGHEGDPRYLGIRLGDRFISVNGIEAMDFSDVLIEAALERRGNKVHVVVERIIDGKPVMLHYHVTPQVGGIGLFQIGVDVPVSLRIPRDESEDAVKALREIWAKKDLYEAGVRPGMAITTAGGQEVASVAEWMDVLAAAKGKPVKTVFEDKEKGGKAELEIDADPWLTFDTKFNTFHLLGAAPAVRIKEVVKNSPAEKAGLKAGDVVALAGLTAWPSTFQISDAVIGANGAAVPIEVIRDGKRISQLIKPDSDNRLGIHMDDGGEKSAIIRETLEGSLIRKTQPLPGGTAITAVNGEKVTNLIEAMELLIQTAAANPQGFEFTLTYREPIKDAPEKTLTLKTDDPSLATLTHARWQPPMTRIFSPDLKLLQTDSPIEAMSLGVYKTKRSIQQVYVTLLRLTQGTVPLSGMQGPVGIADTGTRIAQRGLTYLCFFLGLISVNLAVINFLPIPIVDGGHMVFLMIEKIKGSPVGPKVQAAALYAGLALIGFVFVYVTFHDIARIFGRVFA